MMASAEYEGNIALDRLDFADEAMAQKVMEEENARRIER
jgi:hypothetical protein